ADDDQRHGDPERSAGADERLDEGEHAQTGEPCDGQGDDGEDDQGAGDGRGPGTNDVMDVEGSGAALLDEEISQTVSRVGHDGLLPEVGSGTDWFLDRASADLVGDLLFDETQGSGEAGAVAVLSEFAF